MHVSAQYRSPSLQSTQPLAKEIRLDATRPSPCYVVILPAKSHEAARNNRRRSLYRPCCRDCFALHGPWSVCISAHSHRTISGQMFPFILQSCCRCCLCFPIHQAIRITAVIRDRPSMFLNGRFTRVAEQRPSSTMNKGRGREKGRSQFIRYSRGKCLACK